MFPLLPSRIPPEPALETAGDRSVSIDRGIATGIDLVLCYFLIEIPIIYLASQLLPDILESLGVAGIFFSIAFLIPIYITYSFAFEWLFGRTPGKVNRGLIVVMADGRPLTLWAAAIRNLLRYIDLVGIPPVVVGTVSALLSPAGQRVGDHIADTVVVRARAPTDVGLP